MMPCPPRSTLTDNPFPFMTLFLFLAVSRFLYPRAIDEHEDRAWLWVSRADCSSFVFPAPVWWMLHRAVLAPPVDAMALFLLSLVVNAVIYLWMKFRR